LSQSHAQQKAQPPQSLRLYVLDCGKITPATVEKYGLKPSEMANTEMITPCFLIADNDLGHRRGYRQRFQGRRLVPSPSW
jgi:hypothetical protein